MTILLASQSPRRKELLESLGYTFNVVSIDCEEVYPQDLAPKHIAGYLAELKADAYHEPKDHEILITADTIVAQDHHVLGKPKNAEEAKEMLDLLSNNTHQVYTGICVKTKEKTITKTDVAHVKMALISEEEIDYYIQHFQPFDKAGAYGIQEWLGMAKIESIQGSYYTIMGLPTHLIYEILRNIKCQ